MHLLQLNNAKVQGSFAHSRAKRAVKEAMGALQNLNRLVPKMWVFNCSFRNYENHGYDNYYMPRKLHYQHYFVAYKYS